MAGRRPKVERIGTDTFRILFDRPLEAEVALMYFGFYPGTSLFWKNGRVVSVVAPPPRTIRSYATSARKRRTPTRSAGQP